MIEKNEVNQKNADDVSYVFDARGNGDGDVVPTITGDHQNRVTDYTAICLQKQSGIQDETNNMYVLEGNGSRPSHKGDGYLESEIMYTLNTIEKHAVCVGNGQTNNISMAEVMNTLDTMHDAQAVMTRSVVRRLTPLECTRLQSYPDGWVDIGDWTDESGRVRKDSDTAKYKALGNSICLPFWYWLLGRIMEYCGEKTMGSLFDGIGGFPLCWNAAGGKTLWASEIEPFCVAVTKKRFGDEATGEKGDWNEFIHRG